MLASNDTDQFNMVAVLATGCHERSLFKHAARSLHLSPTHVLSACDMRGRHVHAWPRILSHVTMGGDWAMGTLEHPPPIQLRKNGNE